MASSNEPSSPTMVNSSDTCRRSGTMSSVTSTTASVTRRAANSIGRAAKTALDTDLPLGAWAGMADATSHAPTLSEIRNGSFSHDGWDSVSQRRESNERLTRRTDSSGRRDSYGRRESYGSKNAKRRTSSGAKSIEPVREHERFDRDTAGLEPFPALMEEPTDASEIHSLDEERSPYPREGPITAMDFLKTLPRSEKHARSAGGKASSPTSSDTDRIRKLAQRDQRAFSSGYIPPKKLPWTTSTAIGLKAFWKWFCTPLGFGITIYGLNVVAWGGMLFLLLCNASPVMCAQNTAQNHYDGCNDINSPRRVWLEIDSQILNALFCVTGFGLIPWRFRDLWYLLRWRLCSEKKYGRAQKLYGLRTLAGIHGGWFRLPGSDTLDQLSTAEYLRTLPSSPNGVAELMAGEEDPRLPHALFKTPAPPLTGIRAPPTAPWKLDFFIWCQVWNTFFQACLCGFMWGMNRYNRPSWATGLFIVLACIVVGVGGIVSFKEGKKVKRVEGVPVTTEQRVQDAEREGGVELSHTGTEAEQVYVDGKGKGKGKD